MAILKPPRGVLLQRGHPLSRGLVGCWLMNEGAGTLVRDASANRNNGSLYGAAAWSVVKHGPCILGGLNTTDSVAVPSTPTQSGMPGLTILARGSNNKATIASTGNEYLAFKLNAYNVGWTQSEQIQASVRLASGTKTSVTATGYHTDGTSLKQFGTWHDGQVVCPIFEGQILSSVAAAAVGSVNVQTNTLYLGGDGDTGSWDGKLEYVYIWGRALSPSEITSVYADPWQMFRRSRIELWTGAMASGSPVGEILIHPGLRGGMVDMTGGLS